MRIVLDTNQFIRALACPPEFATLVMAWASARFTVVCSDELLNCGCFENAHNDLTKQIKNARFQTELSIDEYEHVLSRTYIHTLIYPESLRVSQ